MGIFWFLAINFSETRFLDEILSSLYIGHIHGAQQNLKTDIRLECSRELKRWGKKSQGKVPLNQMDQWSRIYCSHY